MTIFEIFDRHSFWKWRQREKHDLTERLVFFFGEKIKILATLTNRQQQWAPRWRSTVKAFSHTHTNSYTLRLISSIFGWRKIVAYYDPLWLTHTENWKHCRICFPFAKKWELCVWQASLLWEFSLFVYYKNAQFSTTNHPTAGTLLP